MFHDSDGARQISNINSRKKHSHELNSRELFYAALSLQISLSGTYEIRTIVSKEVRNTIKRDEVKPFLHKMHQSMRQVAHEMKQLM